MSKKLWWSPWCRIVFLMALVTAGLLTWSQCGRDASRVPASGRNIEPVRVWTGPDSGVSEQGYFLVHTPEEWERIWLAHLQAMERRPNEAQDRTPRINFRKRLIVVLFHGNSFNNSGLAVEEVSERHDRIVLRYDEVSFQTDYVSVPTQAYAFVVLPRTEKSIVIEENVCPFIGGTPEWARRATLEPGKRRRAGGTSP